MIRRLVLVALATLLPETMQAATLEVGPGKTFATVQSAVNAARPGDLVLVDPGTYAEGVFIPNGLGDLAAIPLTIKALFPARQPLDGGPWADTAAKRSVINAAGQIAGFYNDCYCSSSRVGNLIIDGFYITGGTDAAVYFVNDHDLWIRNNVAVNNGYDQGENFGNYNLNWTTNSLVQNNYAEYSIQGLVSDMAHFGIDGADNIMEYNECYTNAGVEYSGRNAYIHGGSANFIFRYNYIHMENAANAALARFRDTVNFTIENNYILSTTAQYFMVVHENEDRGLIEGHRIDHNTYAFVGGGSATYDALGLGYQNQTTVANNIFYSGIDDVDSYYVGPAWLQPSADVRLSDNVVWGFIPRAEPSLSGFTETGTRNVDPALNLSSGCASGVDNNLYGSDLDVTRIPYRRCDGTLYPFATKFSSSPADTIPPSPMRDLMKR